MQIKAKQIAELLGGTIYGNPDVLVSGPSKIEEGIPGTLTFLANPRYKEYIYSTKASVVLIDRSFVRDDKIEATLIVVDNVYLSLAILMEKFNSGLSISPEVSSDARVHISATIGENVRIEPFAIIKQNVTIGRGTKVFGQVYIGDNVLIGEDVTLFPGVKIYHNCVVGNRCVIHANTVIGSDGFGFARDESGNYKKIHQTGNVVIGDDVEIGSNTVIDRASIGSTFIHSGVKLDNLIQIGHNVSIGNNTVIAAQTGIAGSSQIGENCQIGGQAGIAGHIKIADGTMVQAQSGIGGNIKGPNAKLYGSPAIDYHNYLKSYAVFRKLPEVIQEIRKLQYRLDSGEDSKS